MIRTVAAFLVTVAVAGACAVLWPGPSIQPGQLLAAHAPLRNDCLACHAVGRGAEAARCVKCHALSGIGLVRVGGAPLPAPRPAVQRLHEPLAGVQCSGCHAEHAGRLGSGLATRFRHEVLTPPVRDDCANCHATQRPADEIHAAAAACGACHSTRGWKPASFDHDRYFRFDEDHPPRCADCHASGRGFKSYSCDKCHPPARIASEHREEGIQDFADCVTCHRSADEHEAGRGGGERGGRGRRGDRRDDDR